MILVPVVLVATMVFVIWNNRTQDREQKTALATCQAALASARTAASADVADAGAQGRLAGLTEAADIRKTTDMTQKALEEHDEPKCNPTLPPYQPCCQDPDVDSWPKPEEFRNGALLHLSCARLLPGERAPWVCARTADRCAASKRRAGDCNSCMVYLASGRSRGEDFVWTGHAIDEMDGPWTADGKRGVLP